MASAEEPQERDTRALISYAETTPSDLYSLLSLSDPTSTTDKDLKRAWRGAALKLHPDKNRGHEASAATAYDEAHKAFEVLSDPAARAAYDARRAREREKQAREEAFEGKRRKMKEDLERKEGVGLHRVGVKRGWDGSEKSRREMEVQRLAADGARRRAEREERLRRERELMQNSGRERDVEGQDEDEGEAGHADAAEHPGSGSNGAYAAHGSKSAPSAPANGRKDDEEEDLAKRTLKVRWPREAPSPLNAIDPNDALHSFFERFGAVEEVILLHDKKVRPLHTSASDGKKAKKVTMRCAMVVLDSIDAARSALDEWKANEKPFQQGWDSFDSVELAAASPSSSTSAPTAEEGSSGAVEPDVDRATGAVDTHISRAPSTSREDRANGNGETNGSGDRNGGTSTDKRSETATAAPSFSFNPAKKPEAGSSRGGPGKEEAPAAKGLLEATMARLREAQAKKRLDEQAAS